MSRRSFVIEVPDLPPRIVALPVRTPLVRPGDDLAALIAQCLRGIARPGDVVCVAETAVAIAQGRVLAAGYIRPSRLARLLARRAGSYATVCQPESMQLVLESAGTVRVLAAAAASALGRVVGRRGDFYRILGPEVAEIDGYTGTMPPYDMHIVLGPKEPQREAARLAQACGCAVCIVDANDLGKVEVLGASPGVNEAAVRACLLHNPAGNADEQTPLVVLKHRPVCGSPPQPVLMTA